MFIVVFFTDQKKQQFALILQFLIQIKVQYLLAFNRSLLYCKLS